MQQYLKRYRGVVGWLFLAVAVGLSLKLTDFTPAKMQTWGNAVEFVRGMFPPDWSALPKVLKLMAETVAIAFLGTLFAFAGALPISFLTARNTGPKWVGAILRGLMSFLRSVPEILWAIIFVVATDFGDIPGIFALAVHNLGILTKLFGEVYESAPVGLQEAVASTGADRGTVLWYGILPWSMPAVFSHSFFRFECNIRTATLLGIVNAGGIGRELMIHHQLFNYQAMTVDILGIVVLVILADGLGSLVRRQVT